VYNDNQTNVILHNKHIQLKYEWDIHKSDIKYWLNLFYSNTIPELNQPIH